MEAPFLSWRYSITAIVISDTHRYLYTNAPLTRRLSFQAPWWQVGPLAVGEDTWPPSVKALLLTVASNVPVPVPYTRTLGFEQHGRDSPVKL